MKHFFAIMMSLVLAGEPMSAQSFDEIYGNQVRTRINNSSATTNIRSYDFKELALNVGYIVDNPGNKYTVTYSLRAGYAYAFVGACDSDCTDVDLTIYGPSGAKIAEDKRPDASPSLWLFNPEAGQYRVEVTVPTCNAPIGCYVALKELYK